MFLIDKTYADNFGLTRKKINNATHFYDKDILVSKIYKTNKEYFHYVDCGVWKICKASELHTSILNNIPIHR